MVKFSGGEAHVPQRHYIHSSQVPYAPLRGSSCSPSTPHSVLTCSSLELGTLLCEEIGRRLWAQCEECVNARNIHEDAVWGLCEDSDDSISRNQRPKICILSKATQNLKIFWILIKITPPRCILPPSQGGGINCFCKQWQDFFAI